MGTKADVQRDTREDAIDIAWQAIDDRNDMDVSLRDFAEAAVDALGVVALAAENARLREALETIERDGYGLQAVQEEHPDPNAYNYHAMKYWSGEARRLRGIARAALQENTDDSH